jgi:hypothetical protein
VLPLGMLLPILLRASPKVLSMRPCKNISHIQGLVIYFYPTPLIKLKLRLQTGGRLLIATHLDQSNHLANQRQGVVNKYNLTVFIRHFEGSRRPWKMCICPGSQRSSSESTDCDCDTSSKISSARPHTK